MDNKRTQINLGVPTGPKNDKTHSVHLEELKDDRSLSSASEDRLDIDLILLMQTAPHAWSEV